MTIVVKRRCKESPIAPAIRMGRKYVDEQLSSWRRFAKDQDRLKGAAIRRYAKKHGLELRYHQKPWVFRSIAGRVQVAMPAGYFAKVDGILHNIIAV